MMGDKKLAQACCCASFRLAADPVTSVITFVPTRRRRNPNIGRVVLFETMVIWSWKLTDGLTDIRWLADPKGLCTHQLADEVEGKKRYHGAGNLESSLASGTLASRSLNGTVAAAKYRHR